MGVVIHRQGGFNSIKLWEQYCNVHSHDGNGRKEPTVSLVARAAFALHIVIVGGSLDLWSHIDRLISFWSVVCRE